MSSVITSVTAVLAPAFIILGVSLIMLAGIGVLRFPDALTRANAATKATGLGLAAVLAGVAASIGTTRAWVVLGLAVLVQFATSPVSGHVIGRASYRSGAPLWPTGITDDLREHYRRTQSSHQDADEDADEDLEGDQAPDRR
jgi:multicomponent Na+:H+ antiporter subunit G